MNAIAKNRSFLIQAPTTFSMLMIENFETLHNRKKHLKHFFLPLIASFEQVLVQVERYEVHSYSATITGMPPQQRCASHTGPAFSLGRSPSPPLRNLTITPYVAPGYH